MAADIIGDIHGHADALEALLTKLGYQERNGAWRHPERQAIFLGDFIDRGPRQLDTVNIVRRMLDAGSAEAVMGNHEFNAIAWFLPDPDSPGEYLRRHLHPRHGHRNRQQHERFLAEVEGKPVHHELVNWFLSLPLWLDLPGIRVVHACWHPVQLEYLSKFLGSNQRLSADSMVSAAKEPEDFSLKDSPEVTPFKAVETILKGVEVPLPPPHTFHDKEGNERDRVRIRWWDSGALTFRNAPLLSPLLLEKLPDLPLPEHALVGHDGGKPVFVGHYWLMGNPTILGPKVACLDYSVAKGGKLVAYRWDGEPELDDKKFLWV